MNGQAILPPPLLLTASPGDVPPARSLEGILNPRPSERYHLRMTTVRRIGNNPRWSDIVIHAGTARWVEVAEDRHQGVAGQISQIFAQIDATLLSIGSSRADLLQIQIYLSDLADAAVLNELWDAWVPAGHPPVRACVGVQLGPGCLAEMIILAAAPAESTD